MLLLLRWQFWILSEQVDSCSLIFRKRIFIALTRTTTANDLFINTVNDTNGTSTSQCVIVNSYIYGCFYVVASDSVFTVAVAPAALFISWLSHSRLAGNENRWISILKRVTKTLFFRCISYGLFSSFFCFFFSSSLHFFICRILCCAKRVSNLSSVWRCVCIK